MESTFVSIVIPVYNGANYMREAIDSALAQTYKNIEVIVVNDGSADDTEAIAKSYGDKIRYFSKENGGVASALNLALSEMKGEYFSWLSHDDVYLPDKIERQIGYLASLQETDVALYSDYAVINAESRQTHEVTLDHSMLVRKPEYSLLRGCVNGITLLIPKKFFDQHGYFDERLRCTQDYALWGKMMARGAKFIHQPAILAQYRDHATQDTKRNPRVVEEGDVLLIDLVERLSRSDRVRLEGSDARFYSEMVLYLRNTPYLDALAHCESKLREALPKSGRIWFMWIRLSNYIFSDVRATKLKFALFTPGKFLRKYYARLITTGWLRRRLKKTVFAVNDSTIRTRFYFEGEYARWKRYKKTPHIEVNRDRKSGKMYFLVPGTAISGGIAVILKHANMLREKGHDVGILSLANKNDTDWFPNQRVKITPYSRIQPILRSGNIDTLIATGYSTAFTVAMAVARRKLYFIQSDERRFFTEDAHLQKIIGETYELPLELVTMARWIQDWLKNEFGRESDYVPNGIDLGLFRPVAPLEPKSGKPRILIEGAIDIPYKGVEDAIQAVKDIDCDVWLVSNSGTTKKSWRIDRFFSRVPVSRMPVIYSSCDILLKMSRVESFCYPPLEMMACGGVSVIRRVTGIEEYAVDNENCLIVDGGAQAKDAIERLISDNELRGRLSRGGLETAKKWSWGRSLEAMTGILSD